MKKLKKMLLFGLLGILGVCLLLIGITAVSNANLPTASQTLDHLSESQKAYLQEATRLRQELGEQLWSGWGEADIPLIVYNEAYAFLTGYPDPPDGWVKMPDGLQRGSAWEPVPNDLFQGEVFYRQPLPDPSITPEAFTVLVGNRWVASLPTREFMEIGFYQGFRADLPSFIQPVFPYRLVYGLIMGSVETYLEALDHEAFHAFQGMTNPARLAQAEQIMRIKSSYPWDDAALEASWKEEMELVLAALGAETDDEALDLTRQYWLHREARRQEYNFTPDMSDFERQREWLEGLAKYSELALGRLAGSSPAYIPISEIQSDPDFAAYTRQEVYWKQQLTEATGSALRSGETRFYYSGLVQAALLDRLSPGWQERILNTDLALEDLLRELTPIPTLINHFEEQPMVSLDEPLGGLFRLSNAQTRSISPENFTGEKGQGGMAVQGSYAARELGQGWKVTPCVSIKAGETFTLADIAGPGLIQHIWMTPTGNWRFSILRIYWEGQEQPSVECPLGDFFTMGWGKFAPVSSLAVCVNPGSAFNCYWPMPFQKHCRMTVTNLAGDDMVLFYQITYALTPIPADSACFHAQFRRINPLPYKDVYTILDGVKGQGHYVGTYLAWGVNNNGWWGEGEIKFFMDGDQDFPTICGTGTEDYFCGSYDFENQETHQYQEFTTPYAGLHQVIRPDGLYRSQMRFGMYRWHIPDPIRFQQDLRVTIQALGWRTGGRYLPLQDDIASVAYWYQSLPTAPFPPLPDRELLEVI